MRRRLTRFAAAPAALVLAFGLAACGDDGASTETMVDEEPTEDTEDPADLEGDVDPGGDDGTDGAGDDPAEDADADADLEVDEQDS